MKNKIIIIFLFITFSYTVYGQEESIIPFYDIGIYQNEKNNTFYIKDNKGKIKMRKIKFVNVANECLQILNRKNKIVYLDRKLNKIKYPEQLNIEVCGTVANYKVEILEQDENFIIKKTDNEIILGGEITSYTIDTISKKGINNIYFVNKEKIIRYDENFYYPETIIIEQNNKIIIRDNKSTEFYDEIDLSNPFRLKIKKNGLFGYYGITKENKYKKLEQYVFNLAHFELENGKCGFIDNNGNEYYK